ncbi:MAG: ribose-phosphate pyrophosphokinase [Bacteroidetes bacterium HGW-Bacteroidetes-4]|jgi:ribose-phosphate pyrophosphokinase|nr:MAG: ribose-phosphate pyrophosphokinase [Bacteroidetes bacterium HGW-Bacteroidetes-4]
MSLTAPIKLFSGTQTKYLAEKIAECYGTNLGRTSVQRFSDGEFQPLYEETVRGSHVFIIQSTFQPSDNLLELLLMIDAAKRASAYKIVAVIPYFGFARQDRKDKPRVSIGAKLIADLLEAAGVSRVMTMDLHADQIQGFFNIPVDHLYASSIFTPYLRSLNLENLTIAAPDMGGTKRAYAYSSYLGTPVVISHKSRSKANEIGDMRVIGDVMDKNVVIVDDMVDTAGTITKAASIMMDSGARSVRVMATHPILSGPAYERIERSDITELIVTDTIPLKKQCDKITVLPVADLFANTIKSVYNQRSISSNFIF